MHAHQRSHERAKTDPLALQLIELAVRAGWKPRECIEFAREAHKLVTSTASDIEAHQTVSLIKDFAADPRQSGKSMADSAPVPHDLKWGPDAGTRRKALQALANQNLTMKESAQLLGISMSLLASAAHRLKIRFRGR